MLPIKARFLMHVYGEETAHYLAEKWCEKMGLLFQAWLNANTPPGFVYDAAVMQACEVGAVQGLSLSASFAAIARAGFIDRLPQ